MFNQVMLVLAIFLLLVVIRQHKNIRKIDMQINVW
jgi:hypothetical protein